MKGQNLLCSDLLNRLGEQKQIVLNKFCNLISDNNFDEMLYRDYFVCCNIPNGLCSFDLLRFYDNTVLNIQLIPKSDFAQENGWQYIEGIMRKNCFYLQHISKSIICYCFCEDDGLYKFDGEINGAVKVQFNTLCTDLHLQNDSIKSEVNIYSILNNTKFLISPLCNTRAFANGEYYLTYEQENICDEILNKINDKKGFMYSVSSFMGGGKSMMIYHIAKRLKQDLQDALIIHGGNYTDGHLRLKMQYGFDICTIKEMALTLHCLKINNKRYSAVFVDDAQRFTKLQIDLIADMFLPQGIPVILAFDMEQSDEKGDIDICKNICDKYCIGMHSRYINGNMRYKSKIDFTF